MLISKPKNISTNTWREEYNVSDVNDFIDSINFETGDIKGKTIYLDGKKISQDKLREAGFIITRNPAKADIVVIDDLNMSMSYRSTIYTYLCDPFINKMVEQEPLGYKYVFNSTIYKYLYKYIGDQALYDNIFGLLSSNNSTNTKLAMEFMANANWEGNEIYIQDIFDKHYYGNIRSNQYKSSISFKGFLESLDFNYERTSLSEASDYRELCKNDEHHEWVYNKFIDKFKYSLDLLVKQFKVKIDKLEYSIDKSLIYNEE